MGWLPWTSTGLQRLHGDWRTTASQGSIIHGTLGSWMRLWNFELSALYFPVFSMNFNKEKKKVLLTMRWIKTIFPRWTMLPLSFIKPKDVVCVRVFVWVRGIHLNPYETYFIIFNRYWPFALKYGLFLNIFIHGKSCLAPQGCNPSVSVFGWCAFFLKRGSLADQINSFFKALKDNS